MNSARRADMRSRSGGCHTVPQIFINNEHIGCEELFRLEMLGISTGFESVLSKALRIAALQYCAGADATTTLPNRANDRPRCRGGADLVALPEAASFLAPSRESLADLAGNEAEKPAFTISARWPVTAGHGC